MSSNRLEQEALLKAVLAKVLVVSKDSMINLEAVKLKIKVKGRGNRDSHLVTFLKNLKSSLEAARLEEVLGQKANSKLKEKILL